jgi:hypothetical protein
MKTNTAASYVIRVTMPAREGETAHTGYLAGTGWTGDYVVENSADAKVYKTRGGAERKIADVLAPPRGLDGTPSDMPHKWTGYAMRVEEK